VCAYLGRVGGGGRPWCWYSRCGRIRICWRVVGNPADTGAVALLDVSAERGGGESPVGVGVDIAELLCVVRYWVANIGDELGPSVVSGGGG